MLNVVPSEILTYNFTMNIYTCENYTSIIHETKITHFQYTRNEKTRSKRLK